MYIQVNNKKINRYISFIHFKVKDFSKTVVPFLIKSFEFRENIMNLIILFFVIS